MSTDYTLAYGTHTTPRYGRCAMEWVSFLAGEPHGDEPVCVSPVVRVYCISLNDSLGDGPRQLLRPYLARTIGTSGDGLDGERSWMAMDWLIRTYVPAWLALAKLPGSAEKLARLKPVTDWPTLGIAVAELREARQVTRVAWADALGSARPAAWTPWAAGRATAREAAWNAGGAAAWAAARVTVQDIAGDRARALAREIAGDGAATVIRAARTSAGRETARQQAHAALAPTLTTLRTAAFALLDRMLPTVALNVPSEASEDSEPERSEAPA